MGSDNAVTTPAVTVNPVVLSVAASDAAVAVDVPALTVRPGEESARSPASRIPSTALQSPIGGPVSTAQIEGGNGRCVGPYLAGQLDELIGEFVSALQSKASEYCEDCRRSMTVSEALLVRVATALFPVREQGAHEKSEAESHQEACDDVS